MERTKILDTSVAIGKKIGLITVITTIEYPTSTQFDFDVLWPNNEDLQKAIELSSALYTIGKPIPASDAIIASMTILRNCVLVTADKHFLYVKEIAPEFNLELTSPRRDPK